MSVNKVILIGHLGQDPETRYTPEGKAITNMSHATSEKWGGEEKTEWHRVVAFGKTAELCRDYLAKGRQVYLEGRLQTREWEKNGVKRYTTEVIADRVVFLKGGNSERQEEAAPRPAPVQSRLIADDNEDVPF